MCNRGCQVLGVLTTDCRYCDPVSTPIMKNLNKFVWLDRECHAQSGICALETFGHAKLVCKHCLGSIHDAVCQPLFPFQDCLVCHAESDYTIVYPWWLRFTGFTSEVMVI